MIKCPNCNAELEDGSKFCEECGTPIPEQPVNEDAGGAGINEPSNADMTVPADSVNQNPNQKDKKKTSALPFVILAVCAALVLLVGVGVFVLSHKSSGSKSDYVMYIKEKELFYNDLKQKTSSQVTDRLVDDSDVSNSGIASAQYSLSSVTCVSKDGKYLFFPDKINDSDDGFTIYCSKISSLGNSADKIDSDIYWYTISDKADYMTYLKDGGSLYSYATQKSYKEKIAGDVENFASSDDGKRVYYINDEGTLYLWTKGKDKEKIDSDIYSVSYISDDFGTVYYIKGDNLYMKTLNKEREKIASDVSSVLKVYKSGHIFYLKDADEEFSMDIFINDDKKEEDSNLQEPKYPNYFSYSDKAQYDKDMEEYEKASEEYSAKKSRDDMREKIEEYTPNISVSILCYYDGKKETELSDGFSSSHQIASDSETMIFSMFDADSVDKVKLSRMADENLSCYEVVHDAVENSSLYSLVCKDKVTALDVDDAYSFKMDSNGEKIIYLEDYDSEDKEGNLYMITVKNGTISDEKLIAEDVYSSVYGGGEIGFAGGSYVYYTDVKDNEGDLYIDGKLVAYDACVAYISSMETNGVYYYYTDYNDDKSHGTLNYYAKGKPVKIADDVYDYAVVGDGKVMLLSDYSTSKYRGDLYLYANKKLKAIDDDVICMLYSYDGSNTNIYSYRGSRE